MREGKERKRQEEAVAASCVGTIVFDGPMFGGSHTLRCLVSESYSEDRMMIEIDGLNHRPRTYRGVMRLLSHRLVQ